MSKCMIKNIEVKTQGPFHSLLTLITTKGLRIVETKEDEEKAITVRVPPYIAERLDVYATATRTSRSFLIRTLLEGALDQMDEIIIEEEERQAKAYEEMSMMAEEIDKAKVEKINKAKSLLEKWQK